MIVYGDVKEMRGPIKVSIAIAINAANLRVFQKVPILYALAFVLL
jgi:hypothetical protein